ncbi:MAG TPA: cyclic nucleotide-binding domain-containing protein [Candidatus Limnocylindria bacterium]|nr:cyclic nucleotide-binding domain-containing protein [Candidatus Limnocylindria bacterium]
MPGPLDFGPFLALGEEARAELLRSCRRERFAARKVIVREGDPPEDAHAIVAGRVRVTEGDPPLVVATPLSPVLIGETAVLSGDPRNATVSAITAVRAYRIPGDALRAACAREPAFEKEVLAFAAVRAGNNFLRRSSPFADLPAAVIESLAARLVTVRFDSGDELLREGDRGDDAFLIRDGEVEVVRGQRVLAALGPGSFVGEVSALTGSPRTATVRARTGVSAFRVSGKDVRPIVKKHEELVSRLESTMQSRHRPRRAGNAAVSPAPDDPDAVIVRDDASGAYLRLTREALAIYEDIDGERTLRDLALLHLQRTGALDPAGVFGTVATLQAAGLVTAPRIASDEPDARLLRLADLVLAPRLELKDADALATLLHRVFGWAFTRAGVFGAIALGIAGLVALAVVFRQAGTATFGLGGLVVAFAGLLLAGIGHETAHAIATKAEGRRIGRAGLGLLWFTPVVYVDTSDAWLIPRHRRVRVNAAGPLFNFAFAGALGAVAFLTRDVVQDIAIWLAAANLVSVAFNLSPLLEFDGYYVLEDLTNMNALRRKSLRFVFGDLVARPRRPATRREAGFLAYAAAALLYVLAMSVIVLKGVPALVSGVLADRVDPLIVPLVGGVLALVLAALLLGPFVGEIAAARAMAAEPAD